MKIRVGSRESRLAIIQSEIVINSIKKYHPEIEIELVTMKTTGDIILDKTLDKIGGKGLFVKELDKALLEEKVDITVHSFKDMPMETLESLPIVAVSERENPYDVLVLPKGASEIDFSKPIGCSSNRRKIQLEKLYKNVTIKSIRGNVITRLEKLDSGEFSAITLAYAGLKRLGLENRISKVFTVDEILPAACQGVIVVQSRKGFDTWFLKEFNDEKSYKTCMSERAFTRALDGGCSSPVAVFGEEKDGKLSMRGLYVNDENEIKIGCVSGSLDDGESLGRTLALSLKNGVKLC